MKRAYYSDSIAHFQTISTEEILGILTRNNPFTLEQTQRNAWIEEIHILRKVLSPYKGNIIFEYSIPRMGQRIDVVLLIGPVIFVLEFKVGETDFKAGAIDQVWDYALDLKNFHESSSDHFIAPMLIATHARQAEPVIAITPQNDKLLLPIKSNAALIGQVIEDVLLFSDGPDIDPIAWEKGRYCPTPTIIEAALALYNGHSVSDISRNDAQDNLGQTTDTLSEIIRSSQANAQKSICFVTGVPGAGKTLVGLNIATTHIDKSQNLHSVFLSGNGPLVKILHEALARDKVRRNKEQGIKIRKKEAQSEVKMFIQNVHHFRDDCLIDRAPPKEHVALFDEAQRAWNLEQTARFMQTKKKIAEFNQSEPEFLISCLDRHPDWAVIVCLVGGGQEIHTGEAGIREWFEALNRSFPDWQIYVSSRLTDSEYGFDTIAQTLNPTSKVCFKDELHLAVSMRSFRAEHVSLLVKHLLDRQVDGSRETLNKIGSHYPIVLTRHLPKAKAWLKSRARGSERYGIVVSSKAERLKPHALNVKCDINPIHWFLNDKMDVRSSYYLEDVATEFHIQGLELDWVCVTWDADLRHTPQGWEHWEFRGNHWNKIRKEDRQRYLLNAYRVLLTRARQGMVIVVPEGDPDDPTRHPSLYDPTFDYLKEIGFEVIES